METEIFACYAHDWQGPDVISFHLTKEEAENHARGNQYIFVERFEFPGDPTLFPETTLDYIQTLLIKRFADSFEDTL